MSNSHETKFQCTKCNHIFSYSELSPDIRQRHLSPCCKRSYHVLSADLDAFFDNKMDVNNDKRYYEYK